MSRVQLPQRFELAPAQLAFQNLFFWPAFSAAQAMANEWVFNKTGGLAVYCHPSDESRAMLAELATKTKEGREQAFEDAIRKMPPDDAMHPARLLFTLPLNGAILYGSEGDLKQVAVDHDVPQSLIHPYVITPSARGVDLSHILTSALTAANA